MKSSIYDDIPISLIDPYYPANYRGRPTKTIPSSSSVSFSLRRILPSEVISEYGVAGLSSETSRGCGTVISPVLVEGTGVASFSVDGTSTAVSFSIRDNEKDSAGTAGGGGACGSDISRNT